MAKSKERNRAIALREKGESIKQIAKKLKVSKSSVSLWCRDIVLNPTQIEKLHSRMVTMSYIGRMKGARMQHERRILKTKEEEKNGKKMIGNLSERDLLIAIIALYWGEGSKKRRQLVISNSDPEMIKFIIVAFKKLWGVNKKDFIFRIGINKIHKNRNEEIKEHWMKITKSPIGQFRKTIFIKAKNKKNYENFATHYGTLTVKIRKSGDIYYKIMGLIHGLIKSI